MSGRDLWNLTAAEKARFWAKVDKRGPDECWPWTGAKSNGGYGNVAIRQRATGAHRVAWAIANGDPGEAHVLHTCDNPPCVNPAHLFLGTSADNALDKARKGRTRGNPLGRKPKLTDEQIRKIRTDQRECAVVATEYGVCKDTIYGIRQGRLPRRACKRIKAAARNASGRDRAQSSGGQYAQGTVTLHSSGGVSP